MSKKNKQHKKKFKYTWCNQTQLGELFGISSVAVGKFLKKYELKSENGEATDKALSEGYATFTPLKDGTKFYMWNKDKIKELMNKEYKPLSEVEIYYNKTIVYIKYLNKLDEEGNDKLASFGWESLFDEVPKHIRKEVKDMVIKNGDIDGYD